VLLLRSERMMESILAVWKCGAHMFHRRRLSGEPNSDGDRRVRITPGYQESGLVSAEAGNRLSTLLPEVRLVKLDQLAHEPDGSNLDVRIEPGDLAYVIFTSGSTGSRRGDGRACRIENHLLAKVSEFEITRDSVIAQTHRTALTSVWQFFAGR